MSAPDTNRRDARVVADAFTVFVDFGGMATRHFASLDGAVALVANLREAGMHPWISVSAHVEGCTFDDARASSQRSGEAR